MTWRTPDFLAYDPERHDALAGDPWGEFPDTLRLDRPLTTVATPPATSTTPGGALSSASPGVVPHLHEQSRPGRIRDGS